MLDFIFKNQLIKTIILLVLLFVIYLIINSIFEKSINFKIKSSKVDNRKINTIKSLFSNILKYIMIFIGLIIILNGFGIKTNTLMAGLGVAGVVIGLSVQDILKDFFAGLFIIIENQFQIGDTVEIGGFKGEVIALGLKTTRIKKYTGEVKIVSNKTIDSVINFSNYNSMSLIDIKVSNNENIEKTQEILEELCENLSNDIKQLQGNIEVWGIEEFSGATTIIRLSFQAKPMEHFTIRRKILKAIKIEFDKRHINIL